MESLGKRVLIDKPGSYDKLRFESFAPSEPKEGEVSIRVEAIGVNYADCVVRMGLYDSAKKYVGWPITPGFEIAGEVIACGKEASKYEVGQKVVGITRFGGYTSHICLSEEQVFDIPKGFSVKEAAAFPTAFLTAYYGMFLLGAPLSGQRMLVHSAAGGVGGALSQLGKLLGCKVVGVVGSSHKVENALRFGADVVIDKSKEDLWKRAEQVAEEGYHIVFDANGVSTLKQSYEHLASPGKLVIYGFHSMLPKKGGRPNWWKLVVGYLRTPRFQPLDMTGQNRSVAAFNLSYLFSELPVLHQATKELWGWAAEGKIKSPPVKSYAFEDVAQAHKDLESGLTIGKLVLCPS